MSAAYEADRQALPPYDATPRPDDGRHLALSVAKWEGRAGLPGKPFLIWAVGSSWTNFQGDGYPLIRAIRERFPNAPPIVYKKHAGSGTPWDFARGWVQQMVIPEQPDLVFTYTNGSPEGLDAMLTAIRRQTTADVIVASLHFFQWNKVTDDIIERFEVDWGKVREVCRKHGVEFVENRRELAEYLRKNALEPAALVGDPVHQNHHGFIRIWDNVTRHVAKPAQFAYEPSHARTPHRRRPARPNGQRTSLVLRRVERRRRSRAHPPTGRAAQGGIPGQPHRPDRAPHAGGRHGAGVDRRSSSRAGTGLLHDLHPAQAQVLPVEAAGSRSGRHRPARRHAGR